MFTNTINPFAFSNTNTFNPFAAQGCCPITGFTNGFNPGFAPNFVNPGFNPFAPTQIPNAFYGYANAPAGQYNNPFVTNNPFATAQNFWNTAAQAATNPFSFNHYSRPQNPGVLNQNTFNPTAQAWNTNTPWSNAFAGFNPVNAPSFGFQATPTFFGSTPTTNTWGMNTNGFAATPWGMFPQQFNGWNTPTTTPWNTIPTFGNPFAGASWNGGFSPMNAFGQFNPMSAVGFWPTPMFNGFQPAFWNWMPAQTGNTAPMNTNPMTGQQNVNPTLCREAA